MVILKFDRKYDHDRFLIQNTSDLEQELFMTQNNQIRYVKMLGHIKYKYLLSRKWKELWMDRGENT